MTKVLHVGLGKCGSSFLQSEIFPRISKKIKVDYIDMRENKFFKIDYNKFHILENLKNISEILPRNFIMSHEDLFSRHWEFSRIERSFNFVKNNFSSDTVILLIIRNPYELLNSIYIQSIHELRYVKPENFFYLDDKSAALRTNNKFNLYNFDQSKLISLYKSYFEKVIVVKYENLNKLDFLKDIFNLDDFFFEELKKNSLKIHNRSISKYGVNFILFLNDLFDVKKFQLFVQNLIFKFEKTKFKIINKILAVFILSLFFQKIFDKIIPYKKYYIKKKYIPIDIKEEILKYEKLKI